MERKSLEVEVRQERGSSAARRLRREGYIPAVLYGRGRNAVALKVKEADLWDCLESNVIIDMGIKGEDEKIVVMVKDLQRSVIMKEPIHVDLHEISLEEKMEFSVTLELVGTPTGVEEGGIVTQVLREVELECLPTAVPSEIKVDISHLGVGDSITVGEVDVPPGTEFLTPVDETVVSVTWPEAEEEEEEEEEITDAEPALVGEEEEEEEE